MGAESADSPDLAGRDLTYRLRNRRSQVRILSGPLREMAQTASPSGIAGDVPRWGLQTSRPASGAHAWENHRADYREAQALFLFAQSSSAQSSLLSGVGPRTIPKLWSAGGIAPPPSLPCVGSHFDRGRPMDINEAFRRRPSWPRRVCSARGNRARGACRARRADDTVTS